MDFKQPSSARLIDVHAFPIGLIDIELSTPELRTQLRVLAELAIHHDRQPAGEANTLSLDFRSIPSEKYVYFLP